MNKTHVIIEAILAVAIIALFALFFSDKKSNTKPALVTADGQKAAASIAYVRMDSLMSQYEYYKAVTEKLEKEAEGHRVQLAGRANALQKAAEDFERRMRTNAFISAEAQQKEQNRLMQMQQSGQRLEAELTQKFATQQQLMLEDIQKTIREQMAEYNKEHGYALILTTAGLDNILYGEPALDITDDVIKYLNERFKKESTSIPEVPATETPATEKK